VSRIVAEVASTPEGRRALEEKPRLDLDLARLRALPAGGGRLLRRKLALARGDPTLEAANDGAFVQAHLYETHDVWHVATGFGSSVAEELGLQTVHAAQIPGRLAPILIAGGLLQAALFVQNDFGARLAAVARGYALGKRAKRLFGTRWDGMWELSLAVVREQIGVAGGLSAAGGA
jgi:ubiquinone biosynthesis protein COQ4